MVSINKILIGIFLVLSPGAYAKSKLPVLMTKQDISNIRLLTSDGKFTYYKRRDGTLVLSSNYKVTELISGEPGANYYVASSKEKKRILISQDNSYNTYFGVRHLHNIYVAGFGLNNPLELGKGLYPTLHRNDLWGSYYNPFTKKIHFVNLIDKAINFELLTYNRINPYFIPQAEMISDEEILFTDLNSKAIPGLLKFNRINKQIIPVYKASAPNEKIEICLGEKYFYLGLFGHPYSTSGSTISRFNASNIDFEKPEIIYQSKNNDLGNFHCTLKNNKLYFIKNMTTENSKEMFEVVELDSETKQLTVLSDLNYVTQVINMDNQLFIPFQGKYFVVLGNEDYKTDVFKNYELVPEGENAKK